MPFLTAEWRKLAIANYTVAPEALHPYLPARTELDTWNGKCYVSLVGFMFLNTKLRGIPVPFHVNFGEVNLRFYVTHRTRENELRRGVVFVREIVPKPALTLVANTLYGENYVTLPLKHRWDLSGDGLGVEYAWKKDVWHSLRVEAGNKASDMQPGSEAEFITEHYWGYTRLGPAATAEYAVQHPRWQVYTVKSHAIDVDFGRVYGKDFAHLGQQQPASVMLAEGSEIAVMRGRKI